MVTENFSTRPSSVLFACNLNAIRSPIAEVLVRHFYGRSITVDSVGVHKADHIDPFAVAVMEEIGIDISGHKPKSFGELEDTLFDLVVSLTPEAHHQAVELARTQRVELAYWPCRDPTAIEGGREQILQAYCELRDDLQKRIRQSFGPPPGSTA